MKLAFRFGLALLAALWLSVSLEAQEPQESVASSSEASITESGQEPEVIAPADGPSDAPRTDASGVRRCRSATSIEEAWIDKLRMTLQDSVCSSAVWFDQFFGQSESVDRDEFYGYAGVGMLYKTAGEWDDQSRFDANIPMPNLSKRLNLFIGRGDEDDFISDRSTSVAEPAAPFEQSAGDSWLAGFGYQPPGKRGQRWSFRLGGKVSSHPYAFGQARWRFNHYVSDTQAVRVWQTFFYRTNDDGFGGTTATAYDWLLHTNLMARASASVTVSQHEHGVAWKSFITLYQDASQRWGKARGFAYQYFIRGYTEEAVTVPEYGFRATYRQQMFRPWLFGEAIVGYSWDKDDQDGEITDPGREGSVNIGFVIEIRFGSRAKARQK